MLLKFILLNMLLKFKMSIFPINVMMNTDNSFILFLLTFQGQEGSNMQVFDGQTFYYQLKVHSIN